MCSNVHYKNSGSAYDLRFNRKDAKGTCFEYKQWKHSSDNVFYIGYLCFEFGFASIKFPFRVKSLQKLNTSTRT